MRGFSQPTTDGTQELADAVRHAATKVPVVTFASGMMASAAYWIGSAADAVYISSDTTQLGSIGVLARHVDRSKADEKRGLTVTEIVSSSSPLKRVVSPHQPLSTEGRETIQDEVDQIYEVFLDNVTRNRGVSREKALGMADGRVFIGQRAVDVGLADGKATLDGLIDTLAARGAA